MIYISTDYVFDGQGTRPWEPDDERHPLNVYGQTKYEGELAVEKWVEKILHRPHRMGIRRERKELHQDQC